MKSNRKIIEVTFTEMFLVEPDNYPSSWNIDKIVSQWFKDPDGHHAGRDGSKIGGSRKFLGYKIKDMKI